MSIAGVSSEIIEIGNQVSQLGASVTQVVTIIGPNAEVQNLRRDPGTQAALRHYEANFARLAQIQTAITQASNDLQCQYDQLRSALAPIRICPPEILGDIFSQMLYFDRRGHTSEQNSIWVLNASQVCREWRAIALHRSELWTCIDTQWPIVLQRHFLTRSRERPLHISSYSYFRDYRMVESWEPDISVREVSNRWRTFSTDWFSCGYNIALLRRIESLTALESISTLANFHKGIEWATKLGHFRSPLPCLTSFSNNSVIGLHHIATHVKNLELVIAPLRLAEWVKFPKTFPNLETLSIRGQNFHDGDFPGATDSASDSDSDDEVLVGLTFPPSSYPSSKCLQFIARMTCISRHFFLQYVRAPKLRSIALGLDDCDRIPNPYVEQFIEASPLIEKMVLSDGMYEIAQALSFLSMSGFDQSPRLPNLRDLKIWVPRLVKDVDVLHSLREFIERRSTMDTTRNEFPPQPVLRKLVVVSNKVVTSDSRHWLEERVGKLVIESHPSRPLSSDPDDMGSDDW